VDDSQLWAKSDAVILLDNYRDYKDYKYYTVIDTALRYGKEVFVTPIVAQKLSLCPYEGQYKILEKLSENFAEIDKEYEARLENNIDMKLYEPDVPIVAVFGQGISCGKFENQLLINHVAEGKYKSVTICSNALGMLFGYYTIPAFLFSDAMAFQEKVVKFNHYLWQIYEQEKPDVIIVGVPEGIAPFKKKEYHHFAEYPLVISSAIDIDISILCTYFITGEQAERDIYRTVDYCENRYCVYVGAVVVSRTLFDIPLEMHEKIIFQNLDDEYIENHCKHFENTKLPIANSANKKAASKCIEQVFRTLEGNVVVM